MINKTIYIALACLLISGTAIAQHYTIEACEALAIENNRKLKNSYLDLDIATQTRREAFTGYFPTVSAAGMVFNANQGLMEMEINLPEILPVPLPLSMMKNGRIATVTAIQPVFTGGKIITGNQLAKIGQSTSQLRTKLTEEEVVLNTRTYFWQTVALQEKLVTLTEVEKFLEQLRKEVSLSVDAGLTTRNDLLRVELQQQEIASNRLSVENGISLYKMLLGQYIGISATSFELDYERGSNELSPDNYFIYPEEALLNRTENKLLDANVQAAQLNKRMTSANRLPTVGVGASYLHHNLTDKSSNAGILFASVSIPISDWWGGSHATKKEQLRYRQAENDRRDTQELMLVEIRHSWNDLYEAWQQIQLALQSIGSAEENLRLNRNFYSAGTIPLSDLLDAQVLLQQSRDKYTDASCSYKIKLEEYLKVTARK